MHLSFINFHLILHTSLLSLLGLAFWFWIRYFHFHLSWLVQLWYASDRSIWVVAFALMPPEKVRLWSIREKDWDKRRDSNRGPLGRRELESALSIIDHGDPQYNNLLFIAQKKIFRFPVLKFVLVVSELANVKIMKVTSRPLFTFLLFIQL